MLLPSAIIKLDIMLLLHNNLHESQSITDSLEPICNLHLCYNFATSVIFSSLFLPDK